MSARVSLWVLFRVLYWVCFIMVFFFKFLSISLSLLIWHEVRKQFQVAIIFEESFTWTMPVHDLGWKTQIWYRMQIAYQEGVNCQKSWETQTKAEGCREINFLGVKKEKIKKEKKITAKIHFIIPTAPSPPLFLLTLHLVAAAS